MLQDRVGEALDLLSNTAPLDAEGRELRLAVGNFFRKRGEVDKALAVHQSLLVQSGLGESFRCRVQLELGMDYYAAGLLDRAEQAFLPLQHKRDYAARSLECLLKIYQREKDWNKAIDSLRRLRRTGKPGHRESIAQFCCELAEEYASRGEDEQALQSARRALKDDRNCVRALLLLARLLANTKDWAEIREIIAAIEQHSPEFLPEILDVAVEFQAHEGGESRVQAWLAHVYEHCECNEAAVLLSRRLADQSGAAAAVSYLTAAARRTPSMLLLRSVLDLMLKSVSAQDADSIKAVIPALLAVIPEDSRRYLCSQCGFQGTELHWRCPSCQTWEAVKPAKQ